MPATGTGLTPIPWSVVHSVIIIWKRYLCFCDHVIKGTGVHCNFSIFNWCDVSFCFFLENHTMQNRGCTNTRPLKRKKKYSETLLCDTILLIQTSRQPLYQQLQMAFNLPEPFYINQLLPKSIWIYPHLYTKYYSTLSATNQKIRTYQDFADSDVINVKVTRFREDRDCTHKKRGVKKQVYIEMTVVGFIMKDKGSILPQAWAMSLDRKASFPYCLLIMEVCKREVTSSRSRRFLADLHTRSGRISWAFLEAFS